MQDQLILLKTAKLAEEKGFDIACPYGYNHHDLIVSEEEVGTLGYLIAWDAPTQNMLQKWLREKHLIHITISPSFGYILCKLSDIKGGRDKTTIKDTMASDFNSFEDALEAGLLTGLKLIK